MIRAHRNESGHILLMSDDGIIIPLTANEAHAVYLLVAEELARLRRQEQEDADA